MIALQSSTLSVDIIDPAIDGNRLGPRFCTGGYIYQVRDAVVGDLLSGPEYPSRDPSPINGQGAPEVFQFTLFDDEQETPATKLIIGVGVVDNAAGKRATESHFDAPVEEYCRWESIPSGDTLTMRTEQTGSGWSLALQKEILIRKRTIVSRTTLCNLGDKNLPYRWFAHPFFPIPAGPVCARLPLGCRLPVNPAFELDSLGSLSLVDGFEWTTGHYELIQNFEGENPFRAVQTHPLVTDVELACNFVPSKIALWANDRTVSLEPFTLGSLATGEASSWEIAYTFGEPRS